MLKVTGIIIALLFLLVFSPNIVAVAFGEEISPTSAVAIETLQNISANLTSLKASGAEASVSVQASRGTDVLIQQFYLTVNSIKTLEQEGRLEQNKSVAIAAVRQLLEALMTRVIFLAQDRVDELL